MRAAALAFLLALAGCSAHNSCCNDGDCWASFVCSADCSQNGGPEGTCLQRCQVDADCNGEVCNEIPKLMTRPPFR